ncbi:MAG: Hsp20/alpha crystallin family protein [Candidatus Thermoplasmatota archaeon]|nr:Hsp20/alpha crystallin family protein [Candidatus Thermoplasmatota archaeon]
MVKQKEKKVKVKANKNETMPIEHQTTPALWNPFDFVDTVDRWLWDDPWRPGWPRRWGSLSPREFMQHRWLEADAKIAPLDLVDTGKEYKLVAEMPGVSKKDLEINVTPNGIRICGETTTETKEAEKGYLRRERSYSTLCRNMNFPEEVNPDGAEAFLKDGILEITLPKKTPTKGRKLPIK